ncbi:Cell morphogenesis protein PAG1 [Coemansia biformis]|uniref:Cell morphogenesis protein PAG1 n=1 Tax=Coemansia biformis TaxID=1286918 RepID=A0A9W8CWI5_9FUNG|nr:Cell morphogenesis protein PAG1 [Coemansia biformis]
MSGEPLSASIDPKILQDLAKRFQTPSQLSGFSRLNIATDAVAGSPPAFSPMNDPTSAGAAPINIAGMHASAHQPSDAAASFGTDYGRNGLAHSFQQQLQQHHQQQQQHHHHQHPASFHQPHTPQQGLFRTHLGSAGQPEMFSPATDDLGDLSPANSYPNHSLAAMASGAMQTSIPGGLLGTQRQVADHMLRMQAFSSSPPPNSPGFQSMSLPAQADWFDNPLAHQQSIGSALDPSSFAAQHIAGSSAADFSPQHQTLMSLVEDGDGDSHKSPLVSYEKRRRRRESHNAVERRRRDNINERIQELFALLPDSVADINVKPNKGAILRKSVDYIRQLQQALQSQNARIHELESGQSPIMQQSHQPQASSGLAAMLAGATGANSSRPQGMDGNAMNTGL